MRAAPAIVPPGGGDLYEGADGAENKLIYFLTILLTRSAGHYSIYSCQLNYERLQ